MSRIVYLFYTWLIAVPLFLVLTLLTALVVIIGCLLGGEKFFSYYPGMIWSRLTCYLMFCPIEVKGRENLDKKQSYVFVSNHQGAFDIFLIYGFLGVPVKWVMKASIGKIPFVGAACRAAGFIFVDNSTAKAATKSVQEGERCLKKGASVVVFPEGSRTYDGKMIRFRKGAYQMAFDQHLPIVPITLNGPFYVLPIGTLNLRRHRMEMIIHPPISTEGIEVSHKGMQQMADQTREVIASALWQEFK
ncbi:1-acyl-sn-glycerol-3-phosphate acyltransferase [Parabacteroides sp. 52]|uniref:lysophospholipid acyltransferase family protein n=1 Tax=unclassified Parabacteroides TaxID=2649774 RepID=UPI0013D701DF|nr:MULTISPECIES: lysophospholipid acyltransferase family protein [unclassified Parabacteroides]MDH6534635.1 1-acyl-sn-glycerol-3-phosphate acyltransferase [Parabacteroides sp. PM5-20]NDV55134.1 1-acyl-sn-glycerol-3-phosphate acyltransferase [Parabacteroides sp. 52]